MVEDGHHFDLRKAKSVKDRIRETREHSTPNPWLNLWKKLRVRGDPSQRNGNHVAQFLSEATPLPVIPIASFP
jgi:hypothetical protein